ncbi:MAG: hypothetical protein OXC60_14875 [Litoreibacter sp.]|nr:hypothetical protein [Litoreibacter sp.]
MRFSVVFLIVVLSSFAAKATPLDAFSISFKAQLTHIMYLIDHDGTPENSASGQWLSPQNARHVTPYGVATGDIIEERIHFARRNGGLHAQCSAVLACAGHYDVPLEIRPFYQLSDGANVSTMFEFARGEIYEDWTMGPQVFSDGHFSAVTFSRGFSKWRFFDVRIEPVSLSSARLSAEVPLSPSLAFLLAGAGSLVWFGRKKRT